MIQNLAEFSKQIDIPEESLKQFIQDFDLDIPDCISPDLNITSNFEKFATDHQEFLKKYDDDLRKEKTAADISLKIHQPEEQVETAIKNRFPNVYDNGIFKSSVSSFGIDHQLGGNYQFIYDYFGHKTALAKRDFIGYRDLFFYIADMLEPFISPEQSDNWGIQKTAGIVVYGPPGSGKIFWAKRIAGMINFHFQEVRKAQLKTIFSDERKINFDHFISDMLKKDKTALFLENFDDIMAPTTDHPNADYEDVKESILHNIEKFVKENVLMIGSAKELSAIEPELLAPGRFDVLIPIFPANRQERAEMILFNMTRNLKEDALLLKILRDNHADTIPFWQVTADKMRVFSNTMIMDFTQSLKKRIRCLYLKNRSEHVTIDQALLDASLKEAASKLTGEYLNNVQQFVQEVSANAYDRFAGRIEGLKQELDSYRAREEPARTIGFHPE